MQPWEARKTSSSQLNAAIQAQKKKTMNQDSHDKNYGNGMWISRGQKHHATVTCEVCIDFAHSCQLQVINISHSPCPGQVEEEIHSDH